MKENTAMWEAICQGLPSTPSPTEVIPLPEILKVIRYCLDSRVEAFDLAISLLDQIKHMRNDVEFLNWQSMVEYEAKKYIRSFETAQKILQYLRNESTLFNAGRAAYKANKLEESKQYFEECLKLNPKDSSTILDYSVTICTMGEFDRALDIIESIDKSAIDQKEQKVVEFNKGWHYIRSGRFKEGIDLLHLGREINVWGSHANKYTKPQWDGTTHVGKTILIVGEGGIGDEVINARFSQIIKERGMNCIMSTVHKNTAMLGRISHLDKVIDGREINNHNWDYWVPCMDLPYTLKIEPSDIPSKPYLYSNPDFVEKWKHKTQTNKKLKVGIRWMGNPRYELELARTIPVELFQQLTDYDVQLFSFQKDDGIKDFKMPSGCIDLASEFDCWDDTMGAMENMDLMITSCTSIAHVSAALGCKTWVVIPLLPYYTWADMKKESYWYDSVSLYRQKVWKDWSDPFEEVKCDLIKLLETT